MNVQGISQNTPVKSTSQQSDPRLKALDQQISDLQKNIRETRKNEKLDQKIKEEKIKEYEQQIQMLQQEKVQIKAEGLQSKQEPESNVQPLVKQETKSESSMVDPHVQNAFIQMDSLKKTEKSLGFVREQAKGALRIAESKSYRREPDPAAAAAAREKLANMDRAILRKASGISEELSEAAKESVSAPKDGLAEEESDREYAKTGTGRMEPGQFLDDEA